eukprot:424343-Hanusia_phi.AAC.2
MVDSEFACSAKTECSPCGSFSAFSATCWKWLLPLSIPAAAKHSYPPSSSDAKRESTLLPASSGGLYLGKVPT